MPTKPLYTHCHASRRGEVFKSLTSGWGYVKATQSIMSHSTESVVDPFESRNALTYARGRLGVNSTTPFSQIQAIYHRLAQIIPSQPDGLETDEVDEELLDDFLDCHESYEHLKMHHITQKEVGKIDFCLSPVAMSPSESLFPRMTDESRSASLSTTASGPSSNPTLDFLSTCLPEANVTNRMPVLPPAPLSITKRRPSSPRSLSIDTKPCRTCATSQSPLGPETLHSLRVCESQLHSLSSLAVNTLPRHTTAEYDLLCDTVTRLRASIDAALSRVQIRYPPVSSKACCTKLWFRLGVPLAQIAVSVNLMGDLEERETKGTRKRAVMALLRWESLLMGAE